MQDEGTAVQALIQIAMWNMAARDRVQIVDFVENVQDSAGLKALQSDKFLPYLKTVHLTIYAEDRDTSGENEVCLDLNRTPGFVSVNLEKLDDTAMKSIQPHDIAIISNKVPMRQFQQHFSRLPTTFLITNSLHPDGSHVMDTFLPVASRKSPCKQLSMYHQPPANETTKSILAIEIDAWNLDWVNDLRAAVISAEEESGCGRIVINPAGISTLA